MTSKTISLHKEAYDTLLREKLEDESFSKVVMRLVSSRGKLSSYSGAWADLADDDINSMKSDIYEMRKSATDALIK